MADKIPLDQFGDRLQSDPDLRARFVEGMSKVLRDLGVEDADLSSSSLTDENSNIVFTSEADASKNRRSVVVAR